MTLWTLTGKTSNHDQTYQKTSSCTSYYANSSQISSVCKQLLPMDNSPVEQSWHGGTDLYLKLDIIYIQHCMDLQLAVDPYKKICALWKHGLTSKNTQSQLTYFCKSNINQTFTNGRGMIWGVRIAIFREIRHLVEEFIIFLSIFGRQKLCILTARLNKSLNINFNSMRGD